MDKPLKQNYTDMKLYNRDYGVWRRSQPEYLEQSKIHAEKQKERYQADLETNRAKSRAHANAYYASNPEFREKAKKAAKAYRDSKQQLVSAKKKVYYAAHRERLNQQSRDWRVVNKAHCRDYQRDYMYNRGGLLRKRLRNHGRVWPSTLARLALGPLTPELRDKVLTDNIKIYGQLTCILCGKPVAEEDLNIEHKTPVTRGGDHSPSNLGVAHASCNLKKGTMTLDEWALSAQKLEVRAS